jgi:4-amino-4-deoxy-L-arabinose transferase-like glycosyltransferase
MRDAILAVIRRRPVVVLLLLCLTAWLPGLTGLPPLDRDESRFAQASKQMLETGNFIDIRFANEPRYKKPVGIYWLQAAATGAVSAVTHDTERNHIWTYRLVSLAGALTAVALTYWCASAFLGIEASFLSALLLGLTLLLASEAKIAKTDATLLATVVGTQGVLLRAYLAAREADRPPLSFATAMFGWAAFAVGILIKGPILPMLVPATVLALALWDREWERGWRWLRSLRPLWGVPLTLAIVAPWLIAIQFQSHGQFYAQALGHDFGAKLMGGEESHGLPPGYYLVSMLLSFWPATLFLAPAVAGAARHWRLPAAKFLICWFVPYWIGLELTPTKLPHYILPLYPALAMAAASFVMAPREQGEWRLWPNISTALYAIGSAALAVALFALPNYYGTGTRWDTIAASAVTGLICLVAAVAMLRGAKGVAAANAILGAVVAYWAFTLVTAPKLDQFQVSPRLAAMVARHAKAGDPPPVLAGYTEPSALFLIGTETKLGNGFYAADVAAAQGGLAAVEDGQRPRFLAHLAELEADARPVDDLYGYNYSRGRPVHITLFRVTAPHEVTTPPQE